MFTPGSCYFFTNGAKTLLRASLCNLCSRQGVEGGQGAAFLSWTVVGEAEEKRSWTPLRSLVFWSVVSLCRYFRGFCAQVLQDLCCDGSFCISPQAGGWLLSWCGPGAPCRAWPPGDTPDPGRGLALAAARAASRGRNEEGYLFPDFLASSFH